MSVNDSHTESGYTFRQLIGGDWCGAVNGGIWDVLDPATEEVVMRVPFGDGEDCRMALEAAASAQESWSSQTPYARAAILKRVADLMRSRAAELGKWTTLESGKPLAQSVGEWAVAADLFEWFAEECKRAYGRVIPARTPGKRMIVLHQPVGVVGVITAWNFPVYNLARAGAAALAAGCAVVFRPSEFTPLSGMLIMNLLQAAGIPMGVVNLVNGDPASIGQQMLDNPACAKIHFTGSQRVGKLLMDGASKTFTRLSLELGGNAPVIVCPDVDVDIVAAGAVAAKFRNAGQVCIAPQRFLVHESIAGQFLETAARQVRALKLGRGMDPATNVGPMINVMQRDRIAKLVNEARAAADAEVLVGGKRPADFDRGYFYEPTLLTNVKREAPIFREELFAPVMPVATFTDLDEVIAYANNGDFGLAAYVWTRDLHAATRTSERLHYGMVGVNEWTPQATEAPFTGMKASGLGREGGREGLEEYLETKLVSFGG